MRNMLNKKGFTLVELMIVVVILGILVVVAVPIFTTVAKNSKVKACESNMRIIRSNLVAYMLGASSESGEPFVFDSYSDSGVNISGILYNDDNFKATFDDGIVPMCTGGNRDTRYAIKATGPNTFFVQCKANGCPNKGKIG